MSLKRRFFRKLSFHPVSIPIPVPSTLVIKICWGHKSWKTFQCSTVLNAQKRTSRVEFIIHHRQKPDYRWAFAVPVQCFYGNVGMEVEAKCVNGLKGSRVESVEMESRSKVVWNFRSELYFDSIGNRKSNLSDAKCNALGNKIVFGVYQVFWIVKIRNAINTPNLTS